MNKPTDEDKQKAAKLAEEVYYAEPYPKDGRRTVEITAPLIAQAVADTRATAYAQGRADAVKRIREAVEAEQLAEDLDNESDAGYRSGISDALTAIDAYGKEVE